MRLACFREGWAGIVRCYSLKLVLIYSAISTESSKSDTRRAISEKPSATFSPLCAGSSESAFRAAKNQNLSPAGGARATRHGRPAPYHTSHACRAHPAEVGQHNLGDTAAEGSDRGEGRAFSCRTGSTTCPRPPPRLPRQARALGLIQRGGDQPGDLRNPSPLTGHGASREDPASVPE